MNWDDMTQSQKVLFLLRLRPADGLTPADALEWVGTMRLAARISDIKETLGPDEEIITLRATSNGKTYARYVLRRREPATLGLV
jgi:hypothetical protein